jgi:BAH domain/C-5 cytosine-specific DNA methylase
VDPNVSTETFLEQLQKNSLRAQTGMGISSSSKSPGEFGDSTGSLWLNKFSFPVSYIKKEAQYLLGEISAYIDSGLDSGETIGILDAPLLAYITKLAKNKQLSFGTDTRAPNRRAGSGITRGRNINDRVLLHENPTTVTRWIGRLAGGLFVRTLLVTDGGDAIRSSPGIEAAVEVDKELDSKSGSEVIKALIDITCDPKVARREAWKGRRETNSVRWIGRPIWRNHAERRATYSAVDIDGDIIHVGDCVAVRPGEDDRGVVRRKTEEGNLVDIWFARVVYLFEEDGDKLAHFRWFSHGGDTCLEETAGPRELFLLDSCDDNPLEAVAGRIHVEFVGGNDSGPSVVELGRDSEKNNFFYRLWYSEEEGYFEDAAMHEEDSDGCAIPEKEHQFCISCEAIGRKQGLSVPLLKGGDIHYRGQHYRVLDFVYILQDSADEPYQIGQIQEFAKIDAQELREEIHSKTNRVRVKLLKRYDSLYRGYYAQLHDDEPPATRDNRRLYLTNKSFFIPADRLEGKCTVKHIDDIDDLSAFKDLEDTFYVADKLSSRIGDREEHLISEVERLGRTEMPFSLSSESEFSEERERLVTFMSEARKLRGMDIFAGAGGLTIGLDQAGAVKTEWAIEFSSAAALAFKSNLPGVKASYSPDSDHLEY